MKENLIKLILLAFCLQILSYVKGQVFSGIVKDKKRNPIEYVNIGVPLKNIGTVCDLNGNYTIDLTNQSGSDSLVFSCIGFETYSITIKEFKGLLENTIFLEKNIYKL